MKEFFVLALIVSLSLVGASFLLSKFSVKIKQDPTVKIEIIQYKDHSYLYATSPGKYGFSLLHDPDCGCKEDI